MASIKASVCLVLAAASVLVAAPAMAQDPPADSSGAAAAPKPPSSDKPRDQQPQEGEDKGNHPAPNSVFAEGLGAGIAYSINYERMVLDELGVRVGLSYVSVSASAGTAGSTASSSTTFLMVPITASYTGIRTRHGAGLELGGGTTLLYTSAAASSLGTSTSGSGLTPLVVAMVGFRLQPVDHAGFMFRVGAMALGGEGLGLSSANASQFGFIPWGYISFGASF